MTTRNRAAAIFLLALVINVVFVLAFVETNKFPQLNSKQTGDNGYLLAVNLLEGRGYVQYFDGLKYELWRPPAFPVFLAGVFLVFGKSILVLRLSLCVLAALAAVTTFFLARRLWDDRVGTIAGVAVALNPGTIFCSGIAAPENLVAFLLPLSFLVLLRMRDELTDGAAAVAGLVIGVVTLTKMFYLVYAVIAVAWLMIQPGDKRRLLRSAGVFAAGVALVLAPWVVRNWMVLGVPRLASTDTGLVLWAANTHSWLSVPHVETTWPPKEFFENFDKLQAMDELTRDRWFVEQGIESIKAHPWDYVQRVFNRIWVMWKPFPYQPSYAGITSKLRVVAMASTFLPVFVLFSMGAWRLRSEIKTFGLIYVLLLAVTGAVSLAHATGRYRTPLEPLLILIAAFMADRLVTEWRARRTKAAVEPAPATAEAANLSRGGFADPDRK